MFPNKPCSVKEIILKYSTEAKFAFLSTRSDALEVTQSPVMFSHSGARAIAKRNRNVPDDVLAKVKEKVQF